MIAPVTHILPIARIQRSRMLPCTGEVLVLPGDKVGATDTIAEAHAPGPHVMLDVRRALGIPRIEDAQQLIERKVGDQLEKGDVIAQVGGVLPRVVRAPANGVIVAIQKGQVYLELFGEKIELKAGINGIVTQVLPEHGAVVEGNGSLIQGVWGNHKVSFGTLVRQAETMDSELTRANLDDSLRGTVVLAGCLGKSDALAVAEELPLKGLILASMSSHLVPLALKASFPLILIEGFGRIPMNSKAFNLLASNEKKEVSINSNWNSILGDRPEIFISLPAEAQPILDTAEFLPGKTVRIHSDPNAGAVGAIMRIRPGQVRLPNGLRAPAADIRLENGQVITLPLANLDVLE